MTSIIKDDVPGRCYLCGRNGPMHVHHMLHGSYRQAADRYGLTVHLCPECHAELHDHGYMDSVLEQEAQRTFEQAYDHDEFIRIFGKSWL